MKIKILFALLFIFTSFNAQAETENWYTYWGVGMSRTSYPDEIHQTLDKLESVSEDRTQIGIDMLGFYFPNTDSSLLGFVVSGASDTISVTQDASISINTYLYSVSAMKFFASEPGNGFFLRADMGMAKGLISYEMPGDSSSSSSDWGYGLVSGLGYGIPISKETRILISANYSIKSIENDTFKTFMFNVGGLW